MIFEESDRLKSIPPYLFAEIDMIIRKKREQGFDVISLGIGDPDVKTPDLVVEELCRQAWDKENHKYPSSYGLKALKIAASDFYKKRFDIDIDPENEVLPLWGSKEGIANIAYTFVNPGDTVLIPDPSYPVYRIGTIFAGGTTHVMPLTEENNFLIDFNEIDKDVAKKSKLMHVNYPGNPTSAPCNMEFFNKLTDFASEYNILVCHDNAYGDIYSEEKYKPVSFLNAKNSKETGIEFYSLSKSFNMTGWRISFAAGNSNVLKSLGKYKSNVDSGVFNAVQYAAAAALENYEEFINENNRIYNRRRQNVWDILDKLGLKYYKSFNTVYIWVKVPEGYTSASFAKLLLDRTNVVVTPGNAYGKHGEGYFRISLTIEDDRLEEALDRMKNVF
ncbi:MAG: LL-diaminopimelate aminotransferase [Actinobacteria bacterium]|nr:LL-diaminopimelate aminotransferase [Actinomycetota bacterium]MCL6087516.1 LL-diaminopimelate aminotransferase [Actinomycetota bacterium]